MFAGMEAATGDYVAIMDVDLQDPPSLLPRMLEAIQNEGYDCVASRRVTRKGEPPIRSFFARAFYRLINRISKTEIVDGQPTAVDILSYNEAEIERIGRIGFETARKRSKKLCSVEKSNVLDSSRLWKNSFPEWSSFKYFSLCI